jgi:hypothetical protein
MKVQRQLLTKIMTVVVTLVLCGGPEVMQAQQATPAPSDPPSSQQTGTTVDPSKGPLEPVPSQNLPNAPQPGQNTEVAPTPQQATPAPQPKAEQQMQEPLGAATAEGVPTVGGGASRPAGAAIAPAKQNQRRSLLLKLGAIAAVGIAGGTIYALSKGTSSKP